MPTLQFKGKSFVQNHHLAVPYHQLVPNKGKSLSDSLSLQDNLIVHGDNLLALKALLPTYAGKIKCIYIDPPYNTGNEGWKYNDNVKSPIIKEWIGNVVGKEGEDLTRHDKWLCMMMPRLKLLRELLTDDGAIFISIDDNEQHNLRLLLDEIFGEENFVANIMWQKKYAASNDTTGIAAMHDFVVVYQKTNSFSRNLLPRTDKQDKLYKYDDNDGRGLWRSDNMLVKSYSETALFPIKNPNTGEEFLPSAGSSWRANQATANKWLKENRIFFGKDGKGAPQLKRYLNEVQQGIVPTTWWPFEEVGHNDAANKELTAIFGDKKQFDTPKPSTLIKQILRLATDKNSIVLDSFAGSGTTAQAVLELNKEDGGNRKFILAEMEDYADNVTAERVRRVIKGVPTSNNDLLKKGLNGSFSFFDLGDPIETSSLLSGSKMPTYHELARYVYYTATGEDFNDTKLDESKHYVGQSNQFDVYMYYKPDVEYLKTTALTLDEARRLRSGVGTRPLLVFAPTKYVEQTELDNLKITFCQLPFEIYKVKNNGTA